MASEAARQKYPEGIMPDHVTELRREAYDAGRVDALREAADRAQQAFIDEQAGVGFARVSTDWLRAEADRIEGEARG